MPERKIKQGFPVGQVCTKAMRSEVIRSFSDANDNNINKSMFLPIQQQ